MIAFSFFSLFAALTAVYMLFLLRLRTGLRYLSSMRAAVPDEDGPESGNGDALPQVSVLLPLRDEQDMLPRCLASLAAQDYPAHRVEFLLIDDHSSDGGARLVEQQAAQDDRFRLLSLGASAQGKKAALTRGVGEAAGDIIVTTDADCMHDSRWLRSVVRPFGDGADVVAGPVVYERKRGMFARLQAAEFLGLVGVGAGFFGIGYPRLCNGANFAYRKECFVAAGGYEDNAGVHSGDDEFLLHDIVYRQGGRAVFATDAAAVVRTDPAAGVGAFLRQRIRWASKGRHYEDRRFVSFLMLLFVYFLFAALSPLVSLTSTTALLAGAVFFALKVVTDTALLFAAAALLRQPLRMMDVLAGEFLHAYYIIVVSILGFFGSFTWKNRNVKNA